MTLLELTTLRNFAIIFIFIVLFGTAAADKFKTLKTPDWFLKQFDGTIIAKLPGGATLGYWVIGTIELSLTLVFLASVLNFALLPFALVGAMFLFGILCFGLRIAQDYQGSANTFIYFAVSLISLTLIS